MLFNDEPMMNVMGMEFLEGFELPEFPNEY